MAKRSERGGGGRGRWRDGPKEPLPDGQKVFDSRTRRNGVILEHARQYTHPQAQPIYNYLIRWQDGQVEALSEDAFRGDHGIETVDE